MEGPREEWAIEFRAPLILEALEHRRGDVEVAQDIAEACRQAFLLLEFAAEHQHRGVGDQRQRGAVARQLAVVALQVAVAGSSADVAVGQAVNERATGVGHREADVLEQGAVELDAAAFRVGDGRCLHQLEHVRMAAHCALAEDDHVAGEDVGAFHGDADRRALPLPTEIVLRPEDDGLAAMDVHRILDDRAAELGRVVFGDGRGDGRLFALVDRSGGHARHRADRVAEAANARQCLFDALEAADRHAELLADARVGAGRDRGHAHAAGGARGQRNRATHRQALDQHAPALADVGLTADQAVERHEHVLAADRAVLERDVQRQVATSDLEARRRARNQRQTDADVLLVAEQALRVEQAERQSDHRRHRCQRDVTFLEGQLEPEHFLAVDDLLADHAEIRNRGGVRAGPGIGQAEARDFAAVGEARQVVVLLLFSAVMQQQFGRAEGIGHGHGGTESGADARQLLQHHRVRVRGEAESAVLLRNDHAEEAVAFEEVPQLRRQVVALVGDLPVVDQAADLFNRAIEKRLFFAAQLRRGLRQQLLPARAPGEQFALPAHRTGFQRHPLGVGQLRRDALVDVEHRLAEQLHAQRPVIEHHRDGSEDCPGQSQRDPRGTAVQRGQHQCCGAGDGPRLEAGADETTGQPDDDQCQQGNECGHQSCSLKQVRIRNQSAAGIVRFPG